MRLNKADVKHPRYRGRFAPTPSGPLHFGSLVAALGSYLDARCHDGSWLVRIEDVDTPRVVPGAADTILRTLEAYGFEWEGPVLYQSQRGRTYRDALEHLRAQGLVYACDCSRKQLAESARRGIDGTIYPGTCRTRHLGTRTGALRLIVPEARIIFDDRQQGQFACDIDAECGDFVLRRADGVYAYHLAVAVDDAEQAITHIIRGADLLTATPRHLALQGRLGYPTPDYLHLPVVLDARGDKLSKQTMAAPIDPHPPLPALLEAAAFLGMSIIEAPDALDDFWPWASTAWPRRRIEPLRGRFWRPGSNPCKS